MLRSPTARIFSVIIMLLCVFSMQAAAAECTGLAKKLRQAAAAEQASRQGARADRPDAGSVALGAAVDGHSPCAKKQKLEKGPLNAVVTKSTLFLAAAPVSILPHRPAPLAAPVSRLAYLHAPATAPPIRIRHCTYRI